MSDLIERQAVIDLCESKDPDYKVIHFKEDVECLPSVSTEKTEPCTHDKPCTECPQYDKEKYYCPHFCHVIRDVIEEVEEKTGRWIEEDMFDGDVAYRCSECNELFWIESGTPKDNEYNFCPKCGAKIEVEE